MTTHYYTNNLDADSKPKNISVTVDGQCFSFQTDIGVFSKSALDFGTKTLLEALELNGKTGKVLDVGCGYGPIAIYVAKTYGLKVDMVDVNERSLGLAKLNAERHGVLPQVNGFVSNCLDQVVDQYEVIITNPPIRAGKQIIFQIYEQSYQHLQIGGELWIVIQKKQGAASTVKKLETMFSTVEIVAKEKGYIIIKAKK
ncbi:MAG: class I SAM-dependent methyltransferase [Culicoidibacterales bacterium]